jgi:hypothetical protein
LNGWPAMTNLLYWFSHTTPKAEINASGQTYDTPNTDGQRSIGLDTQSP